MRRYLPQYVLTSVALFTSSCTQSQIMDTSIEVIASVASLGFIVEKIFDTKNRAHFPVGLVGGVVGGVITFGVGSTAPGLTGVLVTMEVASAVICIFPRLLLPGYSRLDDAEKAAAAAKAAKEKEEKSDQKEKPKV